MGAEARTETKAREFWEIRHTTGHSLEHTSTLSLLVKRQAELRVVLAGSCSNQTRVTNMFSFHRS